MKHAFSINLSCITTPMYCINEFLSCLGQNCYVTCNVISSVPYISHLSLQDPMAVATEAVAWEVEWEATSEEWEAEIWEIPITRLSKRKD